MQFCPIWFWSQDKNQTNIYDFLILATKLKHITTLIKQN